jgi:hypothetical protein
MTSTAASVTAAATKMMRPMRISTPIGDVLTEPAAAFTIQTPRSSLTRAKTGTMARARQ